MTTSDERRVGHCSPEELRRIAEGASDVSAASRLHVGSCATCRSAIDALRQTHARESLASAPPTDLFERIKARRVAGERVVLPVDEVIEDDIAAARDGHPSLFDVHRVADGEVDPDADAALTTHVRGCAPCTREMEDARRVSAMLSVASFPPAESFDRITARRKSGDRVLLPIEQPTTDATRPSRTIAEIARPRRRIAPSWALAIAAMLLLALGISRVLTSRAAAVVAVDSTATSPQLPVPGSREDSILLSAPTSTALRGRELRAAIATLDAAVFAIDTTAGDTIRLGVRDAGFTEGGVSPRARDALRLLADVLASRLELRVAIVGNAEGQMTDSRVAALTARMRVTRDALAAAGRTADTAFVRTTAPPGAERVELLLLTPRARPELR